MKYPIRTMAAFCIAAVALCEANAQAEGYVQNLDAKPLMLPCGLKFGEVYEGAVTPGKSNYFNGIESKRYEAVITNNWRGFEVLTVILTGKKRIEGVRGMRKGGQTFDEAMTNIVRQKEAFAKEYGISFSGDAKPKCYGDMKAWSLTGKGAGEESVYMDVTESKWMGGKEMKVVSSITVMSRLADKLEAKDLDAEAAELRAAIKKVFGVDLDAPLEKPLHEYKWEKLATPVEGLTERRCSTGYSSNRIGPIETLMYRHVFDGDVSRDELIAAAQRVVTALEKAYGKKLPDARKNLNRSDGKDHGIPAAFDTMVGDVNECCVAYGAVGSMVVTVEYAEPRYALRDGKYELVFKGGVRLSISRAGWMR